MHQVGLYETQTGVLLKEQIVSEKQNELSVVSEFLRPLWVKGRILSADALHTQKTFCATVDAYGGFYLLIVKGNQPTWLCCKKKADLLWLVKKKKKESQS